MQVVDSTFLFVPTLSRGKLMGDAGPGPIGRRVVLDMAFTEAKIWGRDTALYVVPKSLAEHLKTYIGGDGNGHEIFIDHHGNVAGINKYSNVRHLKCIHGNLVPREELERFAGSLGGEAIEPELFEVPYETIPGRQEVHDGRYAPLPFLHHSDPRVMALLISTFEADIKQAVGRGRSVNRTAANPLDIEIWSRYGVHGLRTDRISSWTRGDGYVYRGEGMWRHWWEHGIATAAISTSEPDEREWRAERSHAKRVGATWDLFLADFPIGERGGLRRWSARVGTNTIEGIAKPVTSKETLQTRLDKIFPGAQVITDEPTQYVDYWTTQPPVLNEYKGEYVTAADVDAIRAVKRNYKANKLREMAEGRYSLDEFIEEECS